MFFWGKLEQSSLIRHKFWPKFLRRYYAGVTENLFFPQAQLLGNVVSGLEPQPRWLIHSDSICIHSTLPSKNLGLDLDLDRRNFSNQVVELQMGMQKYGIGILKSEKMVVWYSKNFS